MFVLKNGYLTTNINVVAFNVNKQTMGVRTDRAVAIEIIIEETDRRTSTGQKYRKSFNMTAVVRGGAVRLDIDTIYLTCAPSLSHLY